MDAILVTVTGLSLAMAGVMGGMLARMLREERRRSDARVALLTDLAAERVPSSPAGAIRLSRDGELFQVDPEPSPWPRRFVAIGAMAGALALGVFVMKASNSPAPAAGGATAARPQAHPLELVSLRHAHDSGTLTVTGLVENPRAGAQLNGVEATVLIFDASGAMLASGRAPLDYTALAPGDESPFVIRVPVKGSVARYRIGFRGNDGRVLGHVDRRSNAVAQRQEP